MYLTQSRSPSGTTYLITIANWVVATDLAQCVADFSPQAQVIVKGDPAAALEAAAGAASIAVASVERPPHCFEGSELARLIGQKGGSVVFIGAEAEELGPDAGYAVLHRPFSSRTVFGTSGPPCPVVRGAETRGCALTAAGIARRISRSDQRCRAPSRRPE